MSKGKDMVKVNCPQTGQLEYPPFTKRPQRQKKKPIDRRPDETVDQFLARGGAITKLPPVQIAEPEITCRHKVSAEKDRCGQCLTVDTEFDGDVLGAKEFIPSYVVSASSYDAAQENVPDNLEASWQTTWDRYENESLPSELRARRITRMPDDFDVPELVLAENHIDVEESEDE